MFFLKIVLLSIPRSIRVVHSLLMLLLFLKKKRLDLTRFLKTGRYLGGLLHQHLQKGLASNLEINGVFEKISFSRCYFCSNKTKRTKTFANFWILTSSGGPAHVKTLVWVLRIFSKRVWENRWRSKKWHSLKTQFLDKKGLFQKGGWFRIL